jgi:hypothetical protein
MHVRKKLRIAAVVIGCLLLVTAISGLSLYYASQEVPEFYQQAIKQDHKVQKRASDQMVRGATALASDLRKRGAWQAAFTAEQINGWLAVDLKQNHPKLLPPEVKEPRVEIRDRTATIACRYESNRLSNVFSLSVDVYLSSPDVVAIEIQSARAGKLPVPLGQVLDGISKAAQNMELPLEWRQHNGNPVALLTIGSARDAADRKIELEKIELRKGTLFLAGRTQPIQSDMNAPLARRPHGRDADQAESDSKKVQR